MSKQAYIAGGIVALGLGAIVFIPNLDPKSPNGIEVVKDGGGPNLGSRSCLSRELCVEWTSLSMESLLAAKEECRDMDGTLSVSRCPQESALGSCTHTTGGSTIFLYASKTLDLENAAQECGKTGGTFSRLRDAEVPPHLPADSGVDTR